MSDRRSSKQNEVEDQLAQLRVRYSVLLRTAKEALNAVTNTSLRETPEELQGGSHELLDNITSIRTMLDDILYIIARSHKLELRSQRYAERALQKKIEIEQTSEKPKSSSTREAKAEQLTPQSTLPKARILAKLQDAESSVGMVQAKIRKLSRHASAKSHRSLLEELSALEAKCSRLKSKVASFASQPDLLSNISSSDLLWTIRDLVLRCEGDARTRVLEFIQHGIIHTMILALMSSSAQLDPKKQWLVVVERITQLVSLARQDKSGLDSDISSALSQILDHPAILRLTMHNHELEKKIKQSAKQELATSELKKPTEEDIERIEYWLLTQVWVSEEELMIDSFAILAASSEEKAARRLTQTQNIGEPLEHTIWNHEPVQAGDTIEAERPGFANDNSTFIQVQGIDESGLDLPTAPSNMLPTAPDVNADSDEDDGSGGEVELDAQRLITIFAPSSARTSDIESASTPSSLPSDEDEGEEMEEDVEQIDINLEERLAALALIDQAKAEYGSSNGLDANDSHRTEVDGAATTDLHDTMAADTTRQDATEIEEAIEELDEKAIDELLSRARRVLEQSKAHDDEDIGAGGSGA